MKAILVDLDNTLVYTRKANALAYLQALREFKIKINKKKFLEISKDRHYLDFLPRITTKVDPKEIAKRKSEIYEDFFPYTQLNKDLKNFLCLAHKDWATALVTTASRSNSIRLLNFHKIEGLFDQCIFGDDVFKHKPHPEPYLFAARVLEVEPKNCIVFEDSKIGEKSARDAGMTVIRI